MLCAGNVLAVRWNAWDINGKMLMGLNAQFSTWPRISIVTPSLNQGKYLDATIRSVLEQEYPNLEYFIMDGGSTDGSLEIIREYGSRVTGWVSEPDQGQAHALNKGFARSTGDLLGWINSDDILLPGALRLLAQEHRATPQAVLLGDVSHLDEKEAYAWAEHCSYLSAKSLVEMWRDDVNFQQPGLYFPRSVYEQAGPLDEAFHYTFDREWLCRALAYAPLRNLHVVVAQFRYHNASKTVRYPLEWNREYRIFLERHKHLLDASQQRLALAALDLGLAETYLHYKVHQPGLGRLHLLGAIRIDHGVFKLRKFWRLVLKAWLPRSFQQWMRPYYLQRLKKHLYR